MPAWLGSVSSLVTIITGVPAIFYLIYELVTVRGAKSEAILFSVVGVEICLLIGWIWYREIKTARKYKYSLAIEDLHGIIHRLRDLTTFLAEKRGDNKERRLNESEMKVVRSVCSSQIIRALDQLSQAYSKVSVGRIRVSIKGVFEEGGRLYVYAFARDTASLGECKEKDEKRWSERLDPLDENEDFDMIYSNDERCFCDGDLMSRNGYRTSSFKSYGALLSYKSTFVWPIRQGNAPELALQTKRCIGFLAIDSDRKKAFSKGSDFPLGAAVADALYHPLSLLNKLNSEYAAH